MKAYIVDTFTDRPMSGNPAGVVPDADGMSRAEKQQIASEFRSSETAFLSRSDRADVRIEFFTPQTEVDFCGHGTIASFLVLERMGRVRVEEGRETELKQETRVGILPVSMTRRDGRVYVTMTQRAPQFGALPADEPNFLLTLHLPRSDLDPLFPIRMANTGNWHIMVGVRSLEVLHGISIEPEKLGAYLRHHGVATVHVFCATEPGIYHCRNFAPGVGVPEDPVTGSAAGAFGAYLADIGVIGEGEEEFKVVQGERIGRPGEVYVRIRKEARRVRTVQVSGTGVIVYAVVPPDL